MATIRITLVLSDAKAATIQRILEGVGAAANSATSAEDIGTARAVASTIKRARGGKRPAEHKNGDMWRQGVGYGTATPMFVRRVARTSDGYVLTMSDTRAWTLDELVKEGWKRARE